MRKLDPCSLAATLAIAVVLGFATSPAFGAPITYTITGTGSGTLNGTPFTNASVTVSGPADTAGITTLSAGVFCNDLASLTIAVNGVGTVTASPPNFVFSNTAGSGAWGFTSGSCAAPVGDRLTALDPTAATYHLDTAVGPSTGTPITVGTFNSSGGPLAFSTMTITFQAVGGLVGPPPTLAATAVPLLDARGLAILAALLAAGAMLARRRSRR